MALKRNETYPGRFSNPTDDHPQGAFKNRTAPGAQDGSYLEQQWANDWDGFFGRLLTLAEISPNGNVDTASSSQYYDALKSLFLQRTDPFGDINSDGTVETALANLGLGEAAKRGVGTGANQIPDMNSFTSGSAATADWYKLPGGLLIQSGINAVGYIGSPFTIGLPVAFSSANYRIVASYDNARAGATYGFAMSAVPSTASAFTINSSSTVSVGPVYAYWIAIGKY